VERAQELAGTYRSGHPQFVLSLALAPTGEYRLVRRGCEGVVGTSGGTWSSDGETLELDPSSEDGMLEGHPVVWELRSDRPEPYLVPAGVEGTWPRIMGWKLERSAEPASRSPYSPTTASPRR
jgi:hypothetical protein